MKKSVVLAILAVLLTALLLVGPADTTTSIAGTCTPDNGVPSNQTEVGNSSASATIMISMTRILNE